MYYPDGWGVLVETLWHLSPGDAKAFWSALARAKTTRPVAFRQHVLLLGQVRLNVPHFVERVCTPATVMYVLEALVAEGQLRRRHCARLQDLILQPVDCHGCWKGDPWDGRGQESVLAPDVMVFAMTGQL